MNPTAVFSKSGKGVQEASGKTSHLSRADRAVLAAFDGKITVADVAEKVGKPFDPKFEQLIEQLEKDGFVRQVSAGVAPPQPAQPPSRPGAGKAPPAAALGEELDFTIFSAPKPGAPKPSGPPVDLAAKAREESERKAKEEHATSYKARQEIERARLEAEARAKAAAQARLQAEAAAKAKAESEAKAKADAEASARAKAAEAEAKVRAEADAKVKAAREAAVRLAADAKAKAEADLQAKLEAERAKGREEAERIRKEAEEKSRREAEELRKTLEEERKAREEAEAARKKAEEQARAEAERVRKEAEEKARKEAEEKARKEAEELRQRLEEERKAREEAEAARKKAEEQAREEERRRREEEERRAREEAERKQREEQERAERKAREEKERAAREAREREEKEKAEREKQERKEREREEKERAEREKQERRQREENERKERERAEREEREERERKDREKREKAEQEKAEKAEREKAEAKAAAPAAPGSFSDSLLADLDSFGQREDEERKAREAAEAAKKKAEQQARAEAERRAREEEERREKEEAERRKRQEAERKAKEEAERKAEEEAREAEVRAAEERKRKARESLAAKAAPQDDDIGVTDEDLDMDEVKRDQKALSQEARRAAREREREQEKAKAKSRPREEAEEEAAPVAAAAPPRVRRPMKWGKPAALALFVLLAAGIGAVHVMPVSTGAYEKAAAEALGVPVKIGSARVSLFTGVQLKMDNISAGPARIVTARAFPALGSLLGERKSFSRIELEGVSLPQQALGAVLAAKARGPNFEVQRVVAQKVKLEGPLVLPVLDADLAFGGEGSVASGTVRGPEGLEAKLAPKGDEVEFDVHAGSFALPVAPEVALNQFDMKGVAGRAGMEISAWSATLFDGVMSGTAKVAWGSSTSLDGVVTVRGMNVGVFAPALVSEGKVEGTGRFSMSGADAGKLGAAARLEGNFTITKGVIGSFDLSRALTTGGRQSSGRTPFGEMVGQGLYDKGAVQLRNVTIGAGALNAGASVDIAPGGALSGRIVADVRAATQTIRATLNLGGTVKEPQVRN